MNIINTCPHAVTIETENGFIKYDSNPEYSIRLDYISGEKVKIDDLPINFCRYGTYKINKELIYKIPKNTMIIVSTLVADNLMKEIDILSYLNTNNIKIIVPNSSPQFTKRDSTGNIVSVSQFILYN